MKKLSAILMWAALMLSSQIAMSADFQLNVSAADIRKAENKYVLSDLGVGEKGILDLARLCADGDILKVNGLTSLSSTRNDWGIIWIATRLPGGSVSIELSPAPETKQTVRDELVQQLSRLVDCRLYPIESADMLAVDSINGMSSSAEILSMPKQ